MIFLVVQGIKLFKKGNKTVMIKTRGLEQIRVTILLSIDASGKKIKTINYF